MNVLSKLYTISRKLSMHFLETPYWSSELIIYCNKDTICLKSKTQGEGTAETAQARVRHTLNSHCIPHKDCHYSTDVCI